MLLPRKTVLTLLCFLALLAISGRRGPVSAMASLGDFKRSQPTLEPQPEPVPLSPVHRQVHVKARPAFAYLSDPVHALNGFYRALRSTASGGPSTRILHYGDSPVTADSITADLREILQERFGDGGHGFVLIAKPWAWYGHRGVEIRSQGWRSQPATQEARAQDGLHGIGGVSFEGGPGAFSVLRLERDHARVEIAFLKHRAGGVFLVQADGQTLGSMNTASPHVQSEWAAYDLPRGARTLRIQVQSGVVRLFGVTFESSSPGLIYHSVGLNGGQVQVIVRHFDRNHWAEQLQHYRPDLVVLNYGTNESVFPKYLDTQYPDELRQVIERIQQALPGTSILMMSPMDRGERGPGGQIVTVPSVPHVVSLQHDIAAQMGCAFFDTFTAMGGSGTMARWYTSRPQLVTADFIHPFPEGARRVGVLLDDALLSGYEGFVESGPK